MRPDRVPDLLLERLVLGELSPEQEAEVRARLVEEEGGLARMEAIEASNAAFLEEHPPRLMKAAVEARLQHESTPRASWLSWRPMVPAAAAIAVLVALAVPFLPTRQSGPGGAAGAGSDGVSLADRSAIRTKGDPRLFLHRRTAQGSEELAPGASVRPGDRLGIRYLAAGARYGVILSVDARGAVALHHPHGPEESTVLVEGGIQTLPFSYELDDAPGQERFWFVTGARPIDVKGLMEAARGAGGSPSSPLRLEEGLRATEHHVVKLSTRGEGAP
jgi:hypothetical protein